MRNLLALGAAALVVLLAWSSLSGGASAHPTPAAAIGTPAPATPDSMLASIDAGRTIPPGDFAVQSYAAKLNNLQRKCIEDRSRIADLAVWTRDKFRGMGQQLTLSAVLDNFEVALTDAPRMQCTEMAAAMVTIAQSGR